MIFVYPKHFERQVHHQSVEVTEIFIVIVQLYIRPVFVNMQVQTLTCPGFVIIHTRLVSVPKYNIIGNGKNRYKVTVILVMHGCQSQYDAIT